MSAELCQQDWIERVNAHLERIITGSWAEYRYVANPADTRLEYHRSVIEECYLRRAHHGQFDIEGLIEELIDHDETQLELASLIIADKQGEELPPWYSTSSLEDVLFQLKLDLAEESGFVFFSEYVAPICNDDLPLFVLCVLAEMHAYFETVTPPKYGVQGAGIVPRAFGQFDAQNVLFPTMIEYDNLLCVSKSRTVQSPVLCRLDRSRISNHKSLKGDVSYVDN